MVKAKSKSLASKKVKRYTVESTRPGSGSSTKISKRALGPVDLAKEKEATQRRIDETLAGLGGRAIERIRDAHTIPVLGQAPHPQEESYRDLQEAGDAMDVDEWEDNEEDAAGDVLHALRDFMVERWPRGKGSDTRTWHQRIERADVQWNALLEQLTNAYLRWRYTPSCSSGPNPPLHPVTPASGLRGTTWDGQGDPAKPGTPEGVAAPSRTEDKQADLTKLGTPEGVAAPSRTDANNADVGVTVPLASTSGVPSRSSTPMPSNDGTIFDSPHPSGPPPLPGAEPVCTSHPSASTEPPSSGERVASCETPENVDSDARDGTYDFAIDVVDMYSLAQTATIRREASDITVIVMAEQGYLAASPTSPSLAITFNTLEHFRLLRLRKPSFSVEAFAKVLCDSYALPYRRRYRTALSDCFDVYLKLLRAIEKRMQAALKRDAPDWRVKNACPACCYELENEPTLKFRRIFCFDGNNSLKRVAKFGDRAVADTREFTESDYFLPPAFVDKYKDEVQGASARGPQIDGDFLDSDHDADEDNDEPTNSVDDGLGDCTRNWKAAAPEQDKTMWRIFDETGVFASACRHGYILWIADMIQSGELFKYPIAIVAKALATLGPQLLIGFDVGCSLAGTIDRSSLAADFKRLECRLCVDAFHGYSHSHKCQTQNHPSGIAGAGIEDLGTMERVFSASNQLASVTRYASRYHRHALIDMYFKQWDDDKYCNLATMLLDNYRQALKILEDDTQAVEDALEVLQCSAADLKRWEKEEAAYFATVGTEDPANVAAVEYVSLLRELHVIGNQLDTATSAFIALVPEDWSSSNPAYSQDVSRTRKRETERRHLRERWERTTRDVIALELQMGIVDRWQPNSAEYIDAMQYISQRDYRVALEKLHGLVVQRLFELHNMNISQTAYKVRTYIAKNLQRRSQAICTAVRNYNTAAQALIPPRPGLDWTKVTHYTFLEEFEFLRDTQNTVRGKPWAQPLARETMKKSRRIARAREEITRCNVEVRRLHTSIVDENIALDQALNQARADKNAIAGPLGMFTLRRKRVNLRLLVVISQIYNLPGFTGCAHAGRRVGSIAPQPTESEEAPATSIHASIQREQEELLQEDQDHGADDSDMANLSRLVNFAMNVT